LVLTLIIFAQIFSAEEFVGNGEALFEPFLLPGSGLSISYSKKVLKS
jgi:hypothetical protein